MCFCFTLALREFFSLSSTLELRLWPFLGTLGQIKYKHFWQLSSNSQPTKTTGKTTHNEPTGWTELPRCSWKLGCLKGFEGSENFIPEKATVPMASFFHQLWHSELCHLLPGKVEEALFSSRRGTEQAGGFLFSPWLSPLAQLPFYLL